MVKQAACLPMVILSGLTGCTGPHSEPLESAVKGPDALDTGARIYNGNCVACHQQDARGVPGVYPSLVGSAVLLGDPNELALWVIRGQRPVSMPAGRYSTRMPQFGWMKAPDAAALFTFLRAHFGNAAPPVAAATMAQALDQ